MRPSNSKPGFRNLHIVVHVDVAYGDTPDNSSLRFCLLQKQIDEAGNETLSPIDKLYVVHVKQGKDQKERAWSAGGPLLPSLQMALARYPHTIIELEVLFTAANAAICCICCIIPKFSWLLHVLDWACTHALASRHVLALASAD